MANVGDGGVFACLCRVRFTMLQGIGPRLLRICAITADCAIVLAVPRTHDQGLMDTPGGEAQSMAYRPLFRKVGQ